MFNLQLSRTCNRAACVAFPHFLSIDDRDLLRRLYRNRVVRLRVNRNQDRVARRFDASIDRRRKSVL